jgi:hypothetical protein
MFIKNLIGLIKSEKQIIADSMLNGNCVNYESYQRLVGQNIGLEKALAMIDELLEKDKQDVE